ncbi:hypothetical protein NQ317_008304 [Molorchus minor]|uniref:Uncharacterized protein n=1 Tax=Molorchus minor TaxID=1323400 RepID=A0ABQ9J1A7_9CUCU|nr:hypothetical protein NQ317_008304 [Molorchus minor]
MEFWLLFNSHIALFDGDVKVIKCRCAAAELVNNVYKLKVSKESKCFWSTRGSSKVFNPENGIITTSRNVVVMENVNDTKVVIKSYSVGESTPEMSETGNNTENSGRPEDGDSNFTPVSIPETTSEDIEQQIVFLKKKLYFILPPSIKQDMLNQNLPCCSRVNIVDKLQHKRDTGCAEKW